MIPEEEWTKHQREFVGSTFPTPKGGVLTVVGVNSRGETGRTIFEVECSTCSKDKELWPEGIQSTKGSLDRGSIPCSCTPIKVPTKEQDLLLANRFLKENTPNLKATALVGTGINKSFIIECEVCSKDKELFPNPFIITKGNLFAGRCPCGCAKAAGQLTDEQDLILINRYLKSIRSTLIARESIRFYGKSNRDFILTCKVCSQDTELWPYGSIFSTKGQLTGGYIPCACTRSPRWTEDQNKIRVQRECKYRGYVFNGWAENYKGKETKILLENPETGNRWGSTNIQHFLAGVGDPSISTGGGFDRTKPAVFYITLFYERNTPLVIKYGISNKIDKSRKTRQERYSGLKGKTLFTYFSEDGEFIENLEKEVGTVIRLERVDRDVLPDGFTEAVYYKPFVMNFIVNYSSMLTKTL